MRYPRRLRPAALALGLLAALAIPPGAAAWVSDVDQVQDQATEMFCIVRSQDAACYNGAAQTFTVGASGYLTHVSLPLSRSAATTADLVIEIRAGAPGGTLLTTSEPVPPGDIPVGSYDGPIDNAEWVDFTLTSKVPVTKGQVLAIVVPPVPLDAEPSYWGWASSGQDVYGGGRRFGGSGVGGTSWSGYVDKSDMAFATWVQLPVARLDGPTRYATAVTISEVNYPAGVPLVYVATGTNFPDALAGAAAAGHKGAPLLLVPGSGSTLPTVVADELKALDPDKIVVLGGPSAVSSAIVTKLKSYGSVVRISGPDRYATAVAISKATYPSAPVDAVYLATGLAFPDALAAASVAGRDGAPLLLVPGKADNLAGVPTVKAELRRLGPSTIVLVGGPSAISAGIASDLGTLFPAADVIRLSGPDRYSTAAKISAASFAGGGHPVAYVATGTNFPDALAGAALAGRDGAPLLLVPGNRSNLAGYPAVTAELSRLEPEQIIIFGGPAAVSTGIASALKAYVVP